MSQVAHQAGAYPNFRSMKLVGVFLLPTEWAASPSRAKCLAQEHNTMSPARTRTRSGWSGVEPLTV